MRFYYEQKREEIESNQIRGIFIGRISFFYNLLLICCLHISISISISMCVCVSVQLFQERCTSHPTHSFCHKEIHLFDIPTTFSILFPPFYVPLCLSILFNWFGWICYHSLHSVVAAWFCLIIRSYSLNFAFEIRLYGDTIMLQLWHCLLDSQVQILKVYSISSIEYIDALWVRNNKMRDKNWLLTGTQTNTHKGVQAYASFASQMEK